ncbi:MAG: EamA family transporter [Desulfatiglans sp.]|jgi:drug/metabolite transporter (DMT)-like permease|nr:EamA family transporter [Desulfatiglans sp.]
MDWRILALVSAAFSAAAAIAEKKSLFKIDALEFSAILSLFAFILAVPFAFFFDFAEINSQALSVLFIKSIFNAIAFYSVMAALKRLDISGSLPLMDLNPGAVAIVAFIFLNESLNIWQISGLILVIIGTYLINVKKGNHILAPFTIFIRSRGHNYILIALIAFTITSVLDKVIVGNFRIKPEAFMFFQHLFNLFLFSLAFIAIRKKGAAECFTESIKNGWPLIAFIGVLTIGYRYSQILAVAGGKVALVLALKRLSVFIACLVGGKLFRETGLAVRLTATLVLLAGTFLITAIK